MRSARSRAAIVRSLPSGAAGRPEGATGPRGWSGALADDGKSVPSLVTTVGARRRPPRRPLRRRRAARTRGRRSAPWRFSRSSCGSESIGTKPSGSRDRTRWHSRAAGSSGFSAGFVWRSAANEAMSLLGERRPREVVPGSGRAASRANARRLRTSTAATRRLPRVILSLDRTARGFASLTWHRRRRRSGPGGSPRPGRSRSSPLDPAPASFLPQVADVLVDDRRVEVLRRAPHLREDLGPAAWLRRRRVARSRSSENSFEAEGDGRPPIRRPDGGGIEIEVSQLARGGRRAEPPRAARS